MSAAMTKRSVLAQVRGLDTETRRRVVCALVGHSRIVGLCFGEVSCERCHDHIGDTLTSTYDLTDCVIVGHDCERCRENFRRLTWRDTLDAPNPFATHPEGR